MSDGLWSHLGDCWSLSDRPENLMVVSKAPSSSIPITFSGTSSTLFCAEISAKVKDPKATSPVPGRLTSSVTFAVLQSSSHQACAFAKRSGPENSARIDFPQPMSPFPRRVNKAGFCKPRSGGRDVSVEGFVVAVRVSRAPWILFPTVTLPG